MFKDKNYWAVILGGSSGFGLATAKKLASWGMNICIVHRDRRGSMDRINEEFEKIKALGVNLQTYNLDALSIEGINEVLTGFEQNCGGGKVRLLMHSIAFGNLKLLAPQVLDNRESPAAIIAKKFGLSEDDVANTFEGLFDEGDERFTSVAKPPKYESELLLEDEDMARTIFAMGTSMYSWTREIFKRKLFSKDARVIGMTSEGNEVAWLGYAAVSAAKVALESVSRSIAKEFAPYGIRSNIVQAGVTNTPALKLIPGSPQLLAKAKARNPLGRTTTPEDVANVIALLSTDEASWVNGTLIRADGGERIAG